MSDVERTVRDMVPGLGLPEGASRVRHFTPRLSRTRSDDEVDEAAEEMTTAVHSALVLAAALDQARQTTAHFTGGAR